MKPVHGPQKIWKRREKPRVKNVNNHRTAQKAWKKVLTSEDSYLTVQNQ